MALEAEAELLEDDTENLEPAEDLSTDDQEDDQDEGEDQGDEIVLDGDDGSHPAQDEQRGIRKRINKLNAKIAKAETGQEQSTADLEVERERNRLLQLALDQQNKPVDGPPNPDDFDLGVSDAEYIKAFQTHITKGVKADMLQTQQTTQIKTQVDTDLRARQVAHYERADTLKVKDYDSTEDAAIAILGQNVVNELISSSDKSPEILYYLGKNPKVAEEINGLITSKQATKAVLRIGALEARLKARPKAKTKHAPDPDEQLSGGTAGGSKGFNGLKGATFE